MARRIKSSINISNTEQQYNKAVGLVELGVVEAISHETVKKKPIEASPEKAMVYRIDT